MKTVDFGKVKLTSGYLFDKQELNRKTTIFSVYDRFAETGRIAAFNFDYDENDPTKIKPHIFWDSDVAKWIESVAYILKDSPDPELEEKADAIIAKVKEHQGADGYFNIYFTVCEPTKRFTNRDWHELYCAGHFMEAAVAYADATGKCDLLDCMDKYSDLIHKVFVEEKSAAFATPGHEEIELALIRMYRYTGKKKYLDLAAHFLNTRGSIPEQIDDEVNQTHKPIREQDTALGHSVRAMYLYTGMAYLAAETGDEELKEACRKLWQDVVRRKMYVTGGIGSTSIGEAFTVPFDLPNDQAYTETCAGIGLIFFSNAMLALENDAKYADVIERALYNGVLSGLSLDGSSFFYENPLEINLADHFVSRYGARRFPITQRLKCFSCSCCPPNITRLLPSLGNYVYGVDGDTLYVNQYISSTLDTGNITCTQTTSYPKEGAIRLSVDGARRVAIRIPEWCGSFKVSAPYVIEKGYAVIENRGEEISVELDLTPKTIYGDPRIANNAGKVCVIRGPIVYCAEGVDNGEHLHSFIIPRSINASETFDEAMGLYTLEVPCRRLLPLNEDRLYTAGVPKSEGTWVKLIPYSCFANRGETDMTVWFCCEG